MSTIGLSSKNGHQKEENSSHIKTSKTDTSK